MTPEARLRMSRLMTKRERGEATPEEIVECRSLWRIAAREKRQNPELKERQRQSAIRCRKRLSPEEHEKRLANVRQWRRNHPDYHKNEVYRKRKRDRKRERVHRDPAFRLICNLRSRCNNALKRGTKTSSLTKSIGCTVPELARYLESKWLPGMSWDNYTSHGWHVDHIKPLAAFNLSDPAQFALAFHYTNLQPLWAIDNILKSDKYSES